MAGGTEVDHEKCRSNNLCPGRHKNVATVTPRLPVLEDGTLSWEDNINPRLKELVCEVVN
jgi:hypothetical protein